MLASPPLSPTLSLSLSLLVNYGAGSVDATADLSPGERSSNSLGRKYAMNNHWQGSEC